MTGADLDALLEQVHKTPGLAALGWAEDEIEQAARRHPGAADALYHAFMLIQPQHGMGVEFVYRGHARELLERVAAGRDTRPGTAVEVCLACAQASMVAPFHTAAVGLYLRAWAQAFPDNQLTHEQAGELAHYEALRSDEIDDLEALTRRKVADPRRQIVVECAGQHHGEDVDCLFMPDAARRPVEDEPFVADTRHVQGALWAA